MIGTICLPLPAQSFSSRFQALVIFVHNFIGKYCTGFAWKDKRAILSSSCGNQTELISFCAITTPSLIQDVGSPAVYWRDWSLPAGIWGWCLPGDSLCTAEHMALLQSWHLELMHFTAWFYTIHFIAAKQSDIGLCWFCTTSAETQLGLPRARISSDSGHLGPSETFPALQQ